MNDKVKIIFNVDQCSKMVFGLNEQPSTTMWPRLYWILTITVIEQKFFLFTDTYAEYKIWIKAYTVKNEGKSSEPLVVMTDVRAPGQPIVVNLTCQNGNTLFLKWLRPTLYYRTVDVYNVHYRPEENKKWEIQVVETVNNTINHMVITKLSKKGPPLLCCSFD